jgi:hypothetical protein
MSEDYNIIPSKISPSVADSRDRLVEILKNAPIPPNELIRHLGLFQIPQDVNRMLFLNDIYRMIKDLHGVIFEFGVRWGSNLATLQSLRAVYEPFNYGRRIVGFDTFKGFPSVHEKDGKSPLVKEGGYGVSSGYRELLEEILSLREKESPVSDVKKFELVEGDASVTVEEYLKRHPETIISMAYFDFDIYEPTKKCLEMILPHLTKGAVIAFDELNHSEYPGETVALKEVLGLGNFSIRRTEHSNYQSYLVYDK